MKTDRELLELAAKAVGMVVLERPWNADDGWFFCESHGEPAMHFRHATNPHAHTNPWMPLTDDGDVLRLAAKLGLKIDLNYASGSDKKAGIGVWISGDSSIFPTFWTAEAKDINAAARQTIVRAAAEIGRAMP